MTNSEIDRLVAEKVMGWVHSTGDAGLISGGATFECWRERGHIVMEHFSPTTDPAHCRMVEDKLIDDGLTLNTRRVGGYPTGVYVEIEGGCYAGVERTEDADSKTYNLAVCLAALKAVGMEVKE
jgi:hypothetical protein